MRFGPRLHYLTCRQPARVSGVVGEIRSRGMHLNMIIVTNL